MAPHFKATGGCFILLRVNISAQAVKCRVVVLLICFAKPTGNKLLEYELICIELASLCHCANCRNITHSVRAVYYQSIEQSFNIFSVFDIFWRELAIRQISEQLRINCTAIVFDFQAVIWRKPFCKLLHKVNLV